MNYSIIIPHKNTPDLLQRCLNSIPRREDVQIIVIDDNSDTNKVDFENFPGLNDPYVEVVFGKNENGRKGAGYARNLGLERANGKWIVFADADDYFTDCFNNVLDTYKNDEENEVVYFKVTSDTNRHLHQNNVLNKIQQNTTKYNKIQNILITGHICPIGKFIKNDFIKKHNISFPEILCNEDTMFNVKVNYISDKKKIDDSVIYFITSNPQSLTHTTTLESSLCRFNVVADVVTYLDKNKVKIPGLYHGLFHYWLLVFAKNKKLGIKLLPKARKGFTIPSIVKGMSQNYPKLRRYWLWNQFFKTADKL